jgi:hypothetical protein
MNNRKVNYKLVANLTDREARDLDDFLESRNDSPTLINLVQERSQYVGRVYRGIKFRKKDLQVGQLYEHWNELSSWTVKEEVSFWFASEDYVPEGLLDDLVEEWGYDPRTLPHDSSVWSKAYEEYVGIVLVCDEGFGFYVNEHLVHYQFSKEEEVIVRGGKWQFTTIKEKKNGKGQVYYEVRLSKATEAVA